MLKHKSDLKSWNKEVVKELADPIVQEEMPCVDLVCPHEIRNDAIDSTKDKSLTEDKPLDEFGSLVGSQQDAFQNKTRRPRIGKKRRQRLRNKAAAAAKIGEVK